MMMLSIAIRVAMLLLITNLIAGSLRHASAATRHVVQLIGLLVALLVPISRIARPEWSPIPMPAVPSFVGGATDLIATSIDSASTGGRLNTVLLLMWAMGVVVVLTRMVVGQLALARWQRQAYPVRSPEWRKAIARVAEYVPAARRVTFLECRGIDVPCTWGTVHPTVLLPGEDGKWRAKERDYALLHELAHVRRFDWTTQLLGRLACALHWYNPLIWRTARSAALAQEEACDDDVLANDVVASDYAALLIEASKANTHHSTSILPVLALARATGTETRIRSLLDARRRRAPVNRRTLATILTLGTALSFSITTASAQRGATPRTSPDSAVMVEVARRICASRVAQGDTRATARYTLRYKNDQGANSASRRMTTYHVVIRDCRAIVDQIARPSASG